MNTQPDTIEYPVHNQARSLEAVIAAITVAVIVVCMMYYGSVWLAVILALATVLGIYIYLSQKDITMIRLYQSQRLIEFEYASVTGKKVVRSFPANQINAEIKMIYVRRSEQKGLQISTQRREILFAQEYDYSGWPMEKLLMIIDQIERMKA